jgi:hypothetical protein
MSSGFWKEKDVGNKTDLLIGSTNSLSVPSLGSSTQQTKQTY